VRNSTLTVIATSLFISGAVTSTPANADPIFFFGYDSGAGAGAAHPSSNAAAAAFDAVANAGGTLQIVDFESTPRVAFTSLVVVPGSNGMTITGSFPAAGGGLSSISNIPGSQSNFSGYNTTVGGENFNKLNGGYEVFSFPTPISAFGAYVSGVQNNAFFSFDDGTSYTVTFSSLFEVGIFGGVAFVGFVDQGRTVSSVTVTIANQLGVPDGAAIDDVRYATAVPEASTVAMLSGGLLFLRLATVRRERAGRRPLVQRQDTGLDAA
jgi:hypothetical protein